jgi:drug/metabolite transporter (DMT)-like permease
MKIGDVSVVIPITDGYVIVTVILSMLFLREILPLTGIIGIILIITGISLISTSANNLNLSNFFNFRKGALPAFLVAIGTGFYFFLVGTVSRGGNWFEVALGIRVAISLTAFAIILLKKIKLMELFKGIVWKWILPGAFLDVLGFTFYNIAISRAGVSYSTIMISAQSLVTVLLSYFFLKEKIYPRQWAGILTALFGLISLQIK